MKLRYRDLLFNLSEMQLNSNRKVKCLMPQAMHISFRLNHSTADTHQP